MWILSSSILLPLALVFLLAGHITNVASALQQPASSRRPHKVLQQRSCFSTQEQQSTPAVTSAALITTAVLDRRNALTIGAISLFTAISTPQRAHARAPGSKDVSEAVQQIRDAAIDLRKLERDWDQYSLIDNEGRAVTDATVIARRVLGGVAPLAGASAIDVAKVTPLYRIDGAFNVIRKAYIESESDSGWTTTLDLELFEELVERILFQVQKADGDLYSVAFASKGTTQISGIYKEAKGQIDQGIVDLEKMISLLTDAGAPGI